MDVVITWVFGLVDLVWLEGAQWSQRFLNQTQKVNRLSCFILYIYMDFVTFGQTFGYFAVSGHYAEPS